MSDNVHILVVASEPKAPTWIAAMIMLWVPDAVVSAWVHGEPPPEVTHDPDTVTICLCVSPVPEDDVRAVLPPHCRVWTIVQSGDHLAVRVLPAEPEQTVPLSASTLDALVHYQNQPLERVVTGDRLSHVFHTVPIAVQIYDPHGNCLAANSAWEDLWGVSREHLHGYNLLLDPQVDRNNLRREMEIAFSGVPCTVAATYYDPSRSKRPGRDRWIRLQFVPRRDSRGRLTEIALYEQDATSEQNFHRELAESKSEYDLLADAIPHMVWASDPSGHLYHINPFGHEYLGHRVADVMRSGWPAVIHPDDRSGWVGATKRAYAAEAATFADVRLLRADDTYRWHLIRIVPSRGLDGHIWKWIGECTDVHEAWLSHERERLLHQAVGLVGASIDVRQTQDAIAKLFTDRLADWCLLDIYDNARAVSHALLGGPNGVTTHVAGQNLEQGFDDQLAGKPADVDISTFLPMLDGPIRFQQRLPMLARGRTLGTITLVRTVTDAAFDPDDIHLALDIAMQCALALDNAILVDDAERRASREAKINAIVREFRSTVDPNAVIEAATREIGRSLGVDRCVWTWIPVGETSCDPVAQQFTAPGVLPITGRFPMDALPLMSSSLLESGRAVTVSDCTALRSASGSAGSSHPELACAAYVAVPAALRSDVAGMLLVQQVHEPRAWTDDDVILLQTVARLLALSLEDARLYAREHRVADILQSAFLADVPPLIGGLSIATSYRSCFAELRVGGDLYDVFALPDGRVALVIADVSGKGLHAAVQTATVKYSLRAFAAEAAAPSLVLSRLNRTMRSDISGIGEHFVTLFYGVYDSRTGRFIYSNAGHESMLLRRTDGEIVHLPSNGPILGVMDRSYEQKTEHVAAGDSLVLFTDGLTEARRTGDRELLDLQRVSERLAACPQECGAGALVAALDNYAATWSGGRATDDIAIMVAQALPAAAGVRRPRPLTMDAPARAERLFEYVFDSRADHAAEVRQALAHWMQILEFDQSLIEDFQTAVTEAFTNAVRHGSPHGIADKVRVTCLREVGDRVIVEVADAGEGLTAGIRAHSMPDPSALGGRGVPLMRELTDRMEVIASADGFRVRLQKLKRTDTEAAATRQRRNDPL